MQPLIEGAVRLRCRSLYSIGMTNFSFLVQMELTLPHFLALLFSALPELPLGDDHSSPLLHLWSGYRRQVQQVPGPVGIGVSGKGCHGRPWADEILLPTHAADVRRLQ